MTLIVLGFFLALSLSRGIIRQSSLLEECQKPGGYEDLLDDTEIKENVKYYSCQKEFTHRIEITNSILTMHSCSFTGIKLQNVDGIIYINVKNNFPTDLSGNIEIQSTNFNSCQGGCIYFISEIETKSIKIANCNFKQCLTETTNGAAAIKIGASSSEIDNCNFIDAKAQGYNAGVIVYDQPDVGDKDLKLTISNCVFDHKDESSYFIILLLNGNRKLKMTNNQFKIADNVAATYVLYSNTDMSPEDYQKWTLENNCMKPLKKDIIIDTSEPTIIDKFEECPAMQCPPVEDPNSKLYINNCDTIYDESTSNVKDSLISFYYCTFKGISNFDSGLGGAIYISTSNNIQKDIKLPLKIYNCEISTCYATKGGAIYIVSTENGRLIEIKDCTFTGNKCQFSETDAYSDDSYGGSIYINARLSSVLIVDSQFDANTAGNGGAICYETDSSSVASSKNLLEGEGEIDYSLKVTGCTFKLNEANNDGGALYVRLLNGDPSKKIEVEKCNFVQNKADESDYDENIPDQILPESGGAIYFEYNHKAATSANFAFVVTSCKFNENRGCHFGGAMCLLLMNNEPSNPIEISHCTFDKNYAKSEFFSETEKIEGYGSDIYYSYNKTSAASSSKKLLATNPSLRVTDCDFSNGEANTQGGSLYLTVKDVAASKPIEFTGCTFKDSISKQGSISIVSNLPSVLFHFSGCEFSGKCHIYFNAISGLIDFSTFNNIVESNPIHYDCYQDVAHADQSFKIENCQFIQDEAIASIVYFVPKATSNFGFSHNSVNISNDSTRIFDCAADATKAGTWQFVNNSIQPGKEEIIKTENAQKIDFEASCSNGFICEQDFSSCTGDKRCEINGNDVGLSYVVIVNTQFTGHNHDTNGGAVELTNYGIVCNKTTFDTCTSKQGGGGIYIYVDKELKDPIHLKDCVFKNCQAVYGGAVYIYSSEEKNVVEVISCQFENNVASKDKNNDDLYGGAALYMTVKSATTVGCKFTKNNGYGVKINNNFKSTQLSLSENEIPKIIVKDCIFEASEKSSSSIYYVQSSQNEATVNVRNCIFKGRLSKNAYHIDGVSLVKNAGAPKLKIDNCKFASNKKSALNLNANLAAFDTKSQVFNFNDSEKKESNNSYNWKLISGLIMTIVGVVVVAVVTIIVKHNNNDDENSKEEKVEEAPEI